MNQAFLGVLSGVLLTAAACNSQTPSQSSGARTSPETVVDTTGAPVETKAPNTTYKPAFAGQTRIGSVKTTTPYEVTVLNTTLKSPWALTELPDGRWLITEKGGVLRIASKDGSLSNPITGIPPVNARGQGGLLGITLDPAFSSNRMVYWVFAEPMANNESVTAVGKGRLSDNESTIENAVVIYRATPATSKGNLHYGGRILFDKTGALIVSTGERSDKSTRPQSQDLQSGLGKLVRITTDGQPATGNPFAGQANARPEIYSYGHRNVQSLAFHPQTGDLWEAEFGPRGGDELNLIRPGKNYGWPTISYGIEYSGEALEGSRTQQEGMEQPVYYWDPTLSPSGMTFYSGDAIPEWKNNLFIGGLSSMHIARLVIKNNKVVGEERIAEDQKDRFRDVQAGKDGALYAVSDGGKLYRIGKK
ncbi:PQQ-dependent sugar dehydrogenase [Flavihumibacter sp. RY-1]|uniref:PQQ-dependent sugar dehydrogenase n=1 Tax=Flavihumibacter fluminis TaxID=2909236 RepID=A0ABS9BLI8_9BACT|nr:PQQ-dependent sugar dehydrogenase [Flavihumibacter fluminis]MCF1716551.1 PQQ-dependent sugar dehydrogenase [Flavihumibacter fluminis]